MWYNAKSNLQDSIIETPNVEILSTSYMFSLSTFVYPNKQKSFILFYFLAF